MPSKGLGASVALGVVNTAGSALVAAAMVPVYLRYLGQEAYGLIGLLAVVQAVVAVLDLGVSVTLNRHMARANHDKADAGVGRLFWSLEWAYGGLALCIGMGLAGLAPWLATDWLKVTNLTPHEAVKALIFMGATVAIRWPIALYQNVLMGADHLVRVNLINIATVLVLNAGVLLAFRVGPISIAAVFLWQGACSLVQLVVLRRDVWCLLPRDCLPRRWDGAGLLRILAESRSLGVLGLLGLMFMQVDKLLLSKLLPLGDVAGYLMATLLASSLYLFVMPVYNVFYPRFARLFASGQRDILQREYRTVSHALAALMFPLASFLAVFGESAMSLWLGNPSLARTIAPILALLAMGSALHGVMFVPHALTLALGAAGLALFINVMLGVLYLPLLVFLVWQHGALGAAAAWLVLHGGYLLLGAALTHSRLLPRCGWPWLVDDIGPPLAVSVLLGLTAQVACAKLALPATANTVLGLVWLGMTWCALMGISERLRGVARNLRRW